MKKSIINLTFPVLFLSACAGQIEHKQIEEIAEPGSSTFSGCYRYFSDKDTVLLDISVHENKVHGNLAYLFFEKDKNEGTLSGNLSGDTLLAYYTFRSEGRASVREVMMLKAGNGWTEGYGNMIERGDSMQFEDKNKVSYTGIHLDTCQ